jgi:serine/threonine protein kinase
MSPDRLKEVEEIFHAVLEIPPPERLAFLRRSCGNDLELLAEVQSLLSYEDNVDSLIDAAPKSLVVEVFGDENGSDLIGKRINQYQIEKKLGEGGMGIVYLATDTRLERKVALKLLADEFARDKTRRNRFFQEAKSASALNHPNILTVHEIGEFEGTHFIVTEFIVGRTLKEFLADEKPTLQAVLDLASQITSALSAAHEAGIIHRDIKPDNIMVRPDGIVKVLDFGIAKLIESGRAQVVEKEGETRLNPATLPGMIIGTPQYMSPEQARGLKIDLRSDVFSMGVLLYEMIAGKPPFSGTTKMDIIGSILKDEPRPLKDFQPQISPNLEHIVSKALRKDRERRYQHIRDLLIDLNDFKRTLEFDTNLLVHQTHSVQAATTLNTTSNVVTQRRFSLVHAFAFLFVAGAVIGGAWWTRPKPSAVAVKLNSSEVVSWASKPGEVYSVGSFSPDGKMVAFASTKSGSKNIWIKQTSSGDAIQITRDEFRNENPIWSPSGEELAYFSAKGDRAGIWRVPVLGGAPTLVTPLEDGSSILRSWSKSNRLYYESRFDLYAIDMGSGRVEPATDFARRSIEAFAISLAPDEKQVAYLTVEGEQWTLSAKGINAEASERLFSGTNEIRNLVWHPDNKKIFFSSLVDGTFQIFVIDRGGGDPQQISASERDCYVLAVAPDGSRILYGSAKEESDIWGFNLKDNKEFTMAADIDSELWAEVSPDGKRIAYQAIKNLSQGNKLFHGNLIIKEIDSDKGPAVAANNAGLAVWSPDGASLAYLREIENKFAIEVASLLGGQRQIAADNVAHLSYTLLPYNRTQTNHFQWSPDSRQIAYLSHHDGLDNISLASRDGGDTVQLTDNRDPMLYLTCPLWSPDGKTIAYTSKTGNSAADGSPSYQVWLVDVATKRVTAVTRPRGFLRLMGWGANGKELLFAATAGPEAVGLQSKVTIHRLEVATGSIGPIAELKDVYLFNIRLSPNGKFVAFAAHRDDTDNLWIMPASGGPERKLTANNDVRLYFSAIAWSPESDSIYFGKQSRYSLLSMLINYK